MLPSLQWTTFAESPQEIIAEQTPILIGCIIVGWLSVILMQVIVLGQATRLYKTQNSSGISIWSYVLFAISSAIGGAWAFCYYLKQICSDLSVAWYAGEINPDIWHAIGAIGQWSIIPLIFYNLLNLILATWMCVFKSKHIKLAKKMNISELQLAKVLLAKQKRELVASNYKLHKRKYFQPVMILTLSYLVIGTFCALIYVFLVPNGTEPLLKFTDEAGKPRFFWSDGIMIISIITSFVTEAFSWPTFIGVLKNRDTSGMSINWAIFVPVTLTVSFLYGLTLATAEITVGGWSSFPPDTIGSIVFNGLIVNYGLLIIKLKNRKEAKKFHMDEIEYTERVLVPEYERKVQAKQEVENLIKQQQEKVLKRQQALEKFKKQTEQREKYRLKRIEEEQQTLQNMKKSAEKKKQQEAIFKEAQEKAYKKLKKKYGRKRR